MQSVKGMVQVDGATYRIVRTAPSQYEVVRVLDDATVGSFCSFPRVEVTNAIVDAKLLREIARTAIQGAKTSWVGRLDRSELRS